jgi:tRNA(Ile)-lysidine synthetase-like protein
VTWSGWELRWRSESAGKTVRRSFTTWLTPGAGAVRGPRAGDRIAPLGGVGRRRVRRLLMEARVPFRQRGHYPVLTRGGEVLWLPGICRSSASVPELGEPALRIDARAAEY